MGVVVIVRLKDGPNTLRRGGKYGRLSEADRLEIADRIRTQKAETTRASRGGEPEA